jgi:Tol biopolymer transport system component
VGQPRVAYLAGEPANLYATGLAAGAAPAALTAEPLGVADYTVSPDGQQIVYAARRADGGADLRLLALDGRPPVDLVLCPGEACTAPAFSPDGRTLAYERHTLVTGATGELLPGPARLHVRGLADPASDAAVTEGAASFPHWSPQGYLTFLDPERSAITVLDLATGQASYMPSSSGERVSWLPDGTGLVYTELHMPAEPTPSAGTGEGAHVDRFFSYLARVTLATNAVENLSGSLELEDASPAVAPTGAWLAFGRKALADGTYAPGRQLWLMRPTGQQAQALTADPFYNQSAFHWNAAGTGLLYMRFNVLDPGTAAEIWRLEIDAGGQVVAPGPRLVAAGYLPEWLP